jgi:hypothetical protein
VGYKTRDLALSEMSDRFVALDLHVVRVTTRTGLLVHGYGNPQITTNVSAKEGYLFFHDVMLKLSRKTGWPDSGYSLGEIDRMFWFRSRALRSNPCLRIVPDRPVLPDRTTEQQQCCFAGGNSS